MNQIKECMKLQYIDINEFKENIYSYYQKIFPKEERKPLKMIIDSYNKGLTKIIKILNNTTLIGFMIINRVKKNGYAVMDYFAILPQYRNRGFGTKALKLLTEQEKNTNGIFIEIEKIGLGKDKEENMVRERRKNFYEKIGFKKLKFDLLLYNVIFMPYIFSNIEINENFIIKEIIDIYKSINRRREYKAKL